MAAVEAHEAALFAGCSTASRTRRRDLYGKAARRAPTAFFNVGALDPGAVAEHLASQGVNVWNGNNYAYELCQVLGLQSDGAVRAGIVHYNDDSDVDRVLRAWPRWPRANRVLRGPGAAGNGRREGLRFT